MAREFVTNSHGVQIDYYVAVALMYDDIREDLHMLMCPCSPQEFFDAYCERHHYFFGEAWELDSSNPVY